MNNLKSFLSLVFLLLLYSSSYAAWTKEILINKENIISINPSIAVNSLGNVYIVWHDKDNKEMYLRKYDGYWSDIYEINQNNTAPFKPIIKSDVFNNLHLIWQDKNISNYKIYHKSLHKNSADNWSENVNIFEGNTSLTNFDFAYDYSGNLHIVWQELIDENYEIFYKNFDIEKGWGQEIRLTNNPASSTNPKIAVDKYNNFHVVWRDNRDDNYEIYYKFFNNSSWSEDYRLTNNPASSEDPAVAIDSLQNVHVVWRDNRDKSYEIYYKKGDGKKWEDDKRLTKTNASATNPDITVDKFGKIHIVWQAKMNGNYKIFYKNFEGEWGEDFCLTNDSYSSYNPKIISDPAGNLHVVWYSQNKDLSDIYYRKFISPRPFIKTTSDTIVNEDIGSAGQAEPSLTIDSYNDVFICWSDVRRGEYNSDIYAQLYNKDFYKQGKNFRVNDDKKSAQQAHPDVSIFADDYFAIVWQDERNGNPDIYCQLYDLAGESRGDNFKISDTDTETIQDQPETSGLKDTPLLVVWRDDRNGQPEIYGQIFDTSMAFLGKNFKISQAQKNTYCRWPALTSTPRGFYIVVWADNRFGKWDIHGQKIRMDGKIIGDNFKINDALIENCDHPSVASDPNGNFVVTWWAVKNKVTNIYAQCFDANSKPAGKNFTVNNSISDIKFLEPAIDMDQKGNFLIAWRDYRNDDPDIYAQRYDSKGLKINNNFLVNIREGEIKSEIDTSKTVYFLPGTQQTEPKLKFDYKGNIIFAWRDYKMGNPDIFTCRFEPVNILPIADVSPSIISEVNQMITLDGSRSRNADGDFVENFFWEQTEGPKVTLQNPNTATPSFIPELIGIQYVFKLTVNDGINNSDPAFVQIVVTDSTPPDISIENLYIVNKQGVKPNINVKDNSKLPVNVVMTLDGNSYKIGTRIFDIGEHELEIIATDQSGNTADKKVTFRIE